MPRRPDPNATELARRAGVDPRTAARWLAGARVQPTSASRLSAAMPLPFTAPPTTAPTGPTPTWTLDQPPPPPTPPRFIPGYHDHTFQAFAAPLAFDGWTVERIRAAISQHDQGIFYESSALVIALTRFGPVFAALGQAIAPAVSLPRHVRGGTRGLARIVRDDVEAQLAPRAGLMPSPYFPPTLWGSCAFDLRTMGFSILQHAYGEPDPTTGVRPVWTRRWPTWATYYQRWRRTFQLLTTEGPVDVVSGDGKFTLLADSEEPHFDGAVRALGIPVLSGTLAMQARDTYINRYGNPKLWATMPPNVATQGPEGDAMMSALSTVRGPDGFGVGPNGSKLEWTSLDAKSAGAFNDAIDQVVMFVAAILLGTDATISKGTGGVYTAPMFEGVALNTTRRLINAIVRGVNQGHVGPWLAFNFASDIARARGWIDPVLDVPLPDPSADARIKSVGERMAALAAQVKAERECGLEMNQARVNQIAARLEVDAPLLAGITEPAPQPDEPASDDIDPGTTAQDYEEPADPEATADAPPPADALAA